MLVRNFLVLVCMAGSCELAAQTVVTTYVTKVQEERESTRWTLTEWLRIKERMRMMDLWLALVSDPKKDKFRPELNIVYGMTRGNATLKDDQGVTEEASTSGAQGRAQLWLTNLLTGTVGIRTLNIDFGGEAYGRKGGNFGEEGGRSMQHSYYAADLRLFGGNIQDTSLVVKYGRYQSNNTVPNWASEGEGQRTGTMAGVELQLYLLKFLGAEGNYLSYGDAKKWTGTDEVRGSYYDYMGFVEVSFLRLMGGVYREQWAFAENGNAPVRIDETGALGGVKLQF